MVQVARLRMAPLKRAIGARCHHSKCTGLVESALVSTCIMEYMCDKIPALCEVSCLFMYVWKYRGVEECLEGTKQSSSLK